MGGRGVPLADHQRCHPPPILGGPYSGLAMVCAPKGGMSMGGRRRPPMIPPNPLFGGWGDGRMPAKLAVLTSPTPLSPPATAGGGGMPTFGGMTGGVIILKLLFCCMR